MIGTRRADHDASSYSAFVVPPHNQAKVARLGRPIAHLDSPELGLIGYSIESRGAVATMVEAMYFPIDYLALAHPPTFTVRTWLDTSGVAEEARSPVARRELLLHATDYIHNIHPSWSEMNGRAGFERESAELRHALAHAEPFAVSITLDGRGQDALAIEHLGLWFAQTTLPGASTLITIAGTPDVRQKQLKVALVQEL